MVRGSVGDLPLELTSFVGRRSELAEARRLLTVSRLVTLTGFGGVGKTRMALRVATDLHRTFPDGVWFVDLTTVRVAELATREVADTQLIAHVVAATLGLREQSAAPQLEALAGQLAGRHLLLVLDNCASRVRVRRTGRHPAAPLSRAARAGHQPGVAAHLRRGDLPGAAAAGA